MSILSGRDCTALSFPGRCGKGVGLYAFCGMVSVPVRIYLGKYTAAEAFSFIGLQIVWVALLGIGVMAFYRFAIKKVVVQGG